MMKTKTLLTTALLMTGLAHAGGGSSVPSGNTIAAIVANDPNFSTLLTAVQAAGLTSTLNSAGPYTVFAPTNAAFAKIPAAQLNAVLNNREQLRALLLNHVVPGRVTAAQVQNLSSVTTAGGGTLNVMVNGSQVMIGDATVTRPNISASNGIIHVIDTVLMP